MKIRRLYFVGLKLCKRVCIKSSRRSLNNEEHQNILSLSETETSMVESWPIMHYIAEYPSSGPPRGEGEYIMGLPEYILTSNDSLYVAAPYIDMPRALSARFWRPALSRSLHFFRWKGIFKHKLLLCLDRSYDRDLPRNRSVALKKKVINTTAVMWWPVFTITAHPLVQSAHTAPSYVFFRAMDGCHTCLQWTYLNDVTYRSHARVPCNSGLELYKLCISPHPNASNILQGWFCLLYVVDHSTWRMGNTYIDPLDPKSKACLLPNNTLQLRTISLASLSSFS